MIRVWQAMLLALSISGVAATETAAGCHNTPVPGSTEHAIVGSLLNLETERTDQLVAALDIDSALIPSRMFYQGLATWYQGYQLQAEKSRSRGMKTLRRALDKLDQRFDANPSTTNRLALGIASGHIARMLFADEEYFAGYKIARSAREHIQSFFQQAGPDHPGYPDALLLKGLFEIYTHQIGNDNSWLFSTIQYQGNRRTGIRYVERAIQDGAVFQLEAIRALLGDVTWETPAFCAYTGLIDEAGEQLENNGDIAVLRQGLLLKCGFAERALEVNREYHATENIARLPDNPLQRARFRIAASLGNVQELSTIQPGQDLGHHHRMALANAHDVAGQRQSARKLYAKLSQDKNVDKGIRTAARIRLKYPFQPPSVAFVKQFDGKLASQCVDD